MGANRRISNRATTALAGTAPENPAVTSSRWRLASREPRSGSPLPESKPDPAAPATPHEDLLALMKAAKTEARPDFAHLFAAFKSKVDDLNGSQRAEILSKVAELVAERDLDQGLEFLNVLDEFRDRHNFVKAVVEAVARGNMAQAAEWATRLPDAQLAQSAHNAIGMKWGQTDLGSSLAWAEGLSDASLRLNALEGVTWAWGQKDPQAAYNWAAQLPESEIRDKVFVKLAKMISTQDPKRGSEWAIQFPEGPGRAEALDYAVFQWAGKDLKAAAAWAERIEDPRLRESSLVAVARSWSNSDPQNATAWAAQFPESQARTSALITTARKWAEANPANAAQWIGQLGEAASRSEIFQSVTTALTTAHPSAAEAWLNGVADPDLRIKGAHILANGDGLRDDLIGVRQCGEYHDCTRKMDRSPDVRLDFEDPDGLGAVVGGDGNGLAHHAGKAARLQLEGDGPRFTWRNTSAPLSGGRAAAGRFDVGDFEGLVADVDQLEIVPNNLTLLDGAKIVNGIWHLESGADVRRSGFTSAACDGLSRVVLAHQRYGGHKDRT